ncbi:ATP-binding protein [Kineosporia rhizophila]|uniref:ATP-binding protein n=1 Tax=Kineosporia rhizophila TaxID=84633 RepID=UPI001E469644|nr:ATP-binding protein [Kineosporia rhizophila]
MTTPGARAPGSREPEGILSWTLDAEDAAMVPRVRRLVMAALRSRAADDCDEAEFDAAEVVVAELLNNTFAHTPGPAWIALSWDGPHPLVSAADLGPGFGDRPELLDEQSRLVPSLPEDALSEHGRGLYLVAELTHDLVVTPRPTGGSVVSVTLRLHRRR